jgi:hypothetical protein
MEGSFTTSTSPQPESIIISKFSKLGIVTGSPPPKLPDFFSDVKLACISRHDISIFQRPLIFLLNQSLNICRDKWNLQTVIYFPQFRMVYGLSRSNSLEKTQRLQFNELIIAIDLRVAFMIGILSVSKHFKTLYEQDVIEPVT